MRLYGEPGPGSQAVVQSVQDGLKNLRLGSQANEEEDEADEAYEESAQESDGSDDEGSSESSDVWEDSERAYVPRAAMVMLKDVHGKSLRT